MKLSKEGQSDFFKKAISHHCSKIILPEISSEADRLHGGNSALIGLQTTVIKTNDDPNDQTLSLIVSYIDNKMSEQNKVSLYSSMLFPHGFSPDLKMEKRIAMRLEEHKVPKIYSMQIPSPAAYLKSKGIGNWAMMAMAEEFEHTGSVDKTAKEFCNIR